MSLQWFRSLFVAQEQLRFDDYIAVIIGSCNQIGKAIALKCVTDEGINVALIDIEQNKESLLELHDELKSKAKSKNIQIESYFIDSLIDMQSINAVAERIKSKFNTNSIQFLFNNMDSLMLCNHDKNDKITPILSSNMKNRNDQLHTVMNTNFWSTLYWTRSFIPLLTSKENMDANRKRFIINTSSFKAAFHSDSIYCVSKQCVHALSEIMKTEIDGMLSQSSFDLKVKILCPRIVEGNDEYNLMNISQQKIIKKVQISMEEFGNIVFKGIRDENVFIIQSHPKIARIYASDQLIGINEAHKQNAKIFTKRLFKSILSKL